MTALSTPRCNYPAPQSTHLNQVSSALLQGEISLETRAHTPWGASVKAQMYLPMRRNQVWQQLTDYPRWKQYFPDVTQSRIIETTTASNSDLTIERRLYQAASKSFLFVTAQVEVYLRVVETLEQRIQFHFESGSFVDFGADLNLKDCMDGTLLTYDVQATPLIPIPSVFIQQAIHWDLPANMRTMRQVICRA